MHVQELASIANVELLSRSDLRSMERKINIDYEKVDRQRVEKEVKLQRESRKKLKTLKKQVAKQPEGLELLEVVFNQIDNNLDQLSDEKSTIDPAVMNQDLQNSWTRLTSETHLIFFKFKSLASRVPR